MIRQAYVFSLILFFLTGCSMGSEGEAAGSSSAASSPARQSDEANSPGKAQSNGASKAAEAKTANFNFPKANGWVNDFANVLTRTEADNLVQKLDKIEGATSVEIAVVTVENIKPFDSIEAYARGLGNAWGVGKSESNNGVLLLMDKGSNKVRIELGDGASELLSDSECQQIINQAIIPSFKKNAFYAGLDKGVEQIIDTMIANNQ